MPARDHECKGKQTQIRNKQWPSDDHSGWLCRLFRVSRDNRLLHTVRLPVLGIATVGFQFDNSLEIITLENVSSAYEVDASAHTRIWMIETLAPARNDAALPHTFQL